VQTLVTCALYDGRGLLCGHVDGLSRLDTGPLDLGCDVLSDSPSRTATSRAARRTVYVVRTVEAENPSLRLVMMSASTSEG